MDLTDEQWERIRPLLPKRKKRTRGRKRLPDRPVLSGILWTLRIGAQWKELPDRFPSYQTCHRRFQEWTKSGTPEKIMRVLAQDLEERGEVSLKECFIDGSFTKAKRGVPGLARPRWARAQRSWQLQTATLFLSPSTLALLHPQKSPWWRKRLPAELLSSSPSVW
jgi:transposase